VANPTTHANQIISAGFTAQGGILSPRYNKYPEAVPSKELLVHLEDISGEGPISGMVLFSYPLTPGKTSWSYDDLRKEDVHLALDAAVFENAGPFPLLFVRGSDDSCVKTNEFEPFIDEIAEETWFLKEYVITIPGGDRELRVEKSAAVSASTDAARRVAMARVCGFLQKFVEFADNQ